MATLAESRGAVFRYGAETTAIHVEQGRAAGVRLGSGEVITADAVIANCDVSALAGFGRDAARAAPPTRAADRSFSAQTWMMTADTSGFDLDHHNVFFSADYAAEFADLKQRRLPAAPTVYVCAQDRGADPPHGPERLQLIVNAPATGDSRPPTLQETDQCETATFKLLQSCGLMLTPRATVRVGPEAFAQMFPATGGALYGRASHGWRAAFQRPGSRTGLAGLYLAGGSCHPGAGVPMAALSGRLASDALLMDRASTRWSRRVATAGGTSTRSATTATTG